MCVCVFIYCFYFPQFGEDFPRLNFMCNWVEIKNLGGLTSIHLLVELCKYPLILPELWNLYLIVRLENPWNSVFVPFFFLHLHVSILRWHVKQPPLSHPSDHQFAPPEVQTGPVRPAQGLQPLDQQLVNATFFKGSVGNDVKDVTCNALEGGCEMFFSRVLSLVC